MASFYPQLLSDRSRYEQKQMFYDQANLINNFDDIVRTQTAEQNNFRSQLSEKEAEISRANTAAICGTISEGFADVRDGLHDVENSVNQLSSLLDWHLQVVIGELKYNNLLSENIALLLRVSESKKVRQENIEKGLKFHRDALLGRPFFYNDALLFLKKAVEDKHRDDTGDHTDYFVLHRIGLIYLYSDELKNYEEAIKYFNISATYSENDSKPNTKRLANILAGEVTQSLQSQSRTVEDIKYLTGESFMHISVAYYDQGKFADAINYAEKAFTIAPSLLDAGFLWAKFLAASNQSGRAAEILKPVIQQDEKYAVRTCEDPDLETKPEILQMNEELRSEEEANTRDLLETSSQLKEDAIKWKIMESSHANDFIELCGNIDRAVAFRERKTYLKYLRAKKLLEEFISNANA